MITLAPNVYVAKYLLATSKLPHGAVMMFSGRASGVCWGFGGFVVSCSTLRWPGDKGV